VVSLPLLLKDIYTRLLENGHKLTPQRWAIISLFLLNRGRHLSADDVYNMLRESYPNNGIATVYRTLELLQEIEVLKRLELGEGKARYQINDDSPHVHELICTECQTVAEFQDDIFASVDAMILRKSGFLVKDHTTKFYGICKNCQSDRNA
jgi:Fur family transcriptional regulator, ferric uptake regulator